MEFQIESADRQASKLKIAITGPSGAGKTMGSLLLAKGINPDGKILIIDSENGRSKFYSDHTLTKGIKFDVIRLQPPYLVQHYLGALEHGIKMGYDTIILDSISHCWEGEGGLQDKKHSIDQRGGNSFTNWRTITKEHNLFVSRMINSDVHLIATMRSKQDHVQEVNEKGKTTIRKVGLAPVQRDGIEYEFDIVFDCDMSHQFIVSKDRTGLFDGIIEPITVQTGEKIYQWHKNGAPLPKPRDYKAESQVLIHAFMENLDAAGLEKWKELSSKDKQEVWKLLDPKIQNWIKELMQPKQEPAAAPPLPKQQPTAQDYASV